jgi:hypothetical protein
MNPADGAAPSSTCREPWPARGGGSVAFLPGEETAARRTTVRFFQRRLKMWEYAALAGAPDHAQVEIGASAGQLYIEMSDPAAAYRAYYYVRRQWWREHGTTIHVAFDLAVGSRSRAVLDQYLNAKRKLESGTKTNLEIRSPML